MKWSIKKISELVYLKLILFFQKVLTKLRIWPLQKKTQSHYEFLKIYSLFRKINECEIINIWDLHKQIKFKYWITLNIFMFYKVSKYRVDYVYSDII